MAESTQYKYLDASGLSVLTKEVLTKVNERITERIVKTLSGESDDNHVASAKAVFDLINSKTHIRFKTFTGAISTAVTKESNVIYLQRDSEEDETWTMYVWDESLNDGSGDWISIGNTEIDLTPYWKKEDIDELKEALELPEGVAITEGEIKSAVSTAFSETNALGA